MRRVLVLFPNKWDLERFADEAYRDRYRFTYYGDDLFTFPGNLKLMLFDAPGFVDEVVARFRGERFDGVLSTDEYVGAILAAAVARRLGLPGEDPATIVLAQHKYYSRLAQRAVVPEAVPDFGLVPLTGLDAFVPAVPFPFFVKPVKGTFSVFADKVASMEALRRHLAFGLVERLLLSRVTRPFNDLVRAYTDFEHDADHFIGESLMKGDQVTVDGFVHGGRVQVMGIVDSVMFPGTHTFERFEYPSRLPAGVQRRMGAVTEAVISGLGFRHGQFNVELFYDWETDRIGVIEVNPRLSYQFADLYEYVDGSNTYDVLLDLAVGAEPSFRSGAGEFRVSASFVGRTFHGRRLERVPTADEVARFMRRYGEATLKVYGKEGTSLKSEMKALGSYRYAILNVAAQNLLELFAIHEDAIEKLPFAAA